MWTHVWKAKATLFEQVVQVKNTLKTVAVLCYLNYASRKPVYCKKWPSSQYASRDTVPENTHTETHRQADRRNHGPRSSP